MDDNYIFLLRLQIVFFQRWCRIGFDACGKARAELYAIRAHFMQIGDILSRQNAASSKHRNFYRRTHIGDNAAHRLVCTEMSARLLALDHDGSCTEFFGNLRQLCRGDDRNDRGPRFLAVLEHITGESRTSNDEIDALVDGDFNGIGKVIRRDHFVDADNTMGRK